MSNVSLEKVYKPSDDVVARKIEGEFIIVPLTAGIGDMEDDLFSLDEVGLAIWERLDGKTGPGCGVHLSGIRCRERGYRKRCAGIRRRARHQANAGRSIGRPPWLTGLAVTGKV